MVKRWQMPPGESGKRIRRKTFCAQDDIEAGTVGRLSLGPRSPRE